MRTSTYTIYAPLPNADTHYLIHGYSGAIDRVSSDVIQFLLNHEDNGNSTCTQDEVLARTSVKNGNADRVGSDTIALLEQRGYLTAKTAGEERERVRAIADWAYKKAVARVQPSFFIIPTYDCNMRCWYCYEAPTRSQMRGRGVDTVMSREMADAAFKCMDDLTAKATQYVTTDPPGPSQRRQLTLFGGEPMMQSTLPIVPHIVERARERQMMIFAVTNGVQLNLFTESLGPEGIEAAQMTLDGPREIHDKVRRGPAYPETYDTILDNVCLALDRQMKVNLRVHVDQHTVGRLGEIYRDLEARGLAEKENLYISTTGRLMWHKGHEVPRYPEITLGQLCESLDDLLPIISRPKRRGLDGDKVEASLRTYPRRGLAGLLTQIIFCNASVSNYGFDPSGAVYPCWDVIGDPKEQIGSYSADGIALNERAEAWWGRSLAKIPQCLDCKYIFFHRGGCAAAPLNFGGTPSSALCGPYENDFIRIVSRFCLAGKFEEEMEKASVEGEMEQPEAASALC